MSYHQLTPCAQLGSHLVCWIASCLLPPSWRLHGRLISQDLWAALSWLGNVFLDSQLGGSTGICLALHSHLVSKLFRSCLCQAIANHNHQALWCRTKRLHISLKFRVSMSRANSCHQFLQLGQAQWHYLWHLAHILINRRAKVYLLLCHPSRMAQRPWANRRMHYNHSSTAGSRQILTPRSM